MKQTTRLWTLVLFAVVVGLLFSSLVSARIIGGFNQIRYTNDLSFNSTNLTVFTNDKVRLFIDEDGNVGIGTVSPNYRLNVNGSINASALNVTGTVQAARFEGDGSGLTNVVVGFDNLSDINVTRFVADQLLFVNNSRLGINTNTPNELVEIHGNVSFGTSGSQLVLFRTDTGASNTQRDFISGTSANSGDIIVSARQDVEVYLDSDSTSSSSSFRILRDDTRDGSASEIFRVSEEGRVGVGTSTPTSELTVIGQANVTGGIIANDTLYVNGSRVGIGTDNLTALLSLGASTSSLPVLSIQTGAQPSNPKVGDIYSDGTDLFFFDGTTWRDLTIETTSGGGFTDDGTTVRLTTSGDFVGIGTTSPAERLTVGGNASFTGNIVAGSNLIYGFGESNGDIGLLGWTDQGSVVRLAESDDNVGIGTASATSKLTVAGNITPSANNTFTLGTPDLVWRDLYLGNDSLYINGVALSSSGESLLWNGDEVTTSGVSELKISGTVNASNFTLASVCADGEVLKFQNGFAICGSDSTSSGSGEIGGEGSAGFVPLFNSSSAINESVISQDSSGRIGIGTTAPTANLFVSGTTNISGTTALAGTMVVSNGNVIADLENTGSVGYIDIDNTNTGTTGIRFLDTGSAHWIIGNDGSDSDKFKISGSSAFGTSNFVAIDRSSGNVGIGSTDPNQLLEIAGTAGSGGAIGIRLNNTNGADHYYDILTVDATSGSERLDISKDGGDPIITFRGNGNVGIGTTLPNNSLDVSGDINVTGTTFVNTLSFADGTTQTTASAGGGGFTNNTDINVTRFVANNTLFVNDSRVGIGTNTPSATVNSATNVLHILQDDTSGAGFRAQSSNSNIELVAGSSKNFLYSASSVPLGIYTSGAERLSIASTGQVGINTASPTSMLTIVNTSQTIGGTITARPLILLAAEDESVEPAIAIRQRNNVAYGFNFANDLNVNGNFHFERVVNNVASTVYIVERDTGDIGFGTTDPTEKIDIGGGKLTFSGTYPSSGFSEGDIAMHNSNFMAIVGGSAGVRLYDDGVSSSEIFVLDGSGRVGIGTDSPSALLDVSGNVAGEVITRIYNANGAAGSDAVLLFDIATASEEMRIRFNDSSGQAAQIVADGGDNSLAFETGTTEAMRIDSSGNLAVGTTSNIGARVDSLGLTSNGVAYRARESSGNAPVIQFTDEAGTTEWARITAPADNELTLSPNGETLRLDSSNRVGITEDDPDTDLHISGATAYVTLNATTSGQSRIDFVDSSNPGLRGGYITGSWGANGLLLDSLESAGHIYVGGSANTDYIHIQTQGTEAIYVDATQDVLIGASNGAGTDNIAYQLTVEGEINVSDGSKSLTFDPGADSPLINTTNNENITIASDDGSVIIQLG